MVGRAYTQDPLAYSVAVYSSNKFPAGTGVVVSRTRIATCLHVYLDAVGLLLPRGQDYDTSAYMRVIRKEPSWRDHPVFIKFQGSVRFVGAKLAEHLAPAYEDDLVLLRLVDPNDPTREIPIPEQIPFAKLAAANPGSLWHPFQVYGFVKTEPQFLSNHAQGTIVGPVKANGWKYEAVQLDGGQVRSGMSGGGILDLRRQLVIGFACASTRCHQGEPQAWAVDAATLGKPPFNLELHESAIGKVMAPRIWDQSLGVRLLASRLDPVEGLRRAPPPPDVWVGREELLSTLVAHFQDPDIHIVSLVGPAGEGKTALARQWVERIRDLKEPPEGVFWWTFEANAGPDAFFQAARDYFASEEPGDPVRALLKRIVDRRVVLVLDGLEAAQELHGFDKYGQFTHGLIALLLTNHGHGVGAFCLLTSRVPVNSLVGLPAYRPYPLDPLPPDEALQLLRLLRRGRSDPSDSILRRHVEVCGGNALLLKLAARGQEELSLVPALAASPTGAAPEGAAVVARYDRLLPAEEVDLLMAVAANQSPLSAAALDCLAALRHPRWANLTAGGVSGLNTLADRLCTLRLLQRDGNRELTVHPLLREYYQEVLERTDPAARKELHGVLARHYLGLAMVAQGKSPWLSGHLSRALLRLSPRWAARGLRLPGVLPVMNWLMPPAGTLEEMRPFLPVVTQLCQAGWAEVAFLVARVQFARGDAGALAMHFGAWEQALAILREFFPRRDWTAEPALEDPVDRGLLQLASGLTLTSLGLLDVAEQCCERALACQGRGAGRVQCLAWQNRALLHIYRGELVQAVAAAKQGIAVAQAQRDIEQQTNAAVGLAWTWRLLGRDSEVLGLYEQQPRIAQGVTGYGAVHLVEVLLRQARLDEARAECEEALRYADRISAGLTLPHLYRLRGQWAALTGDEAHAGSDFDAAVERARAVSFPPALIETLLARGQWQARKPAPEVPAARRDLQEAECYARAGGYRLYQAGARLGLAWSAWAAGDGADAREELNAADTMAHDMGWQPALDSADALRAALAKDR